MGPGSTNLEYSVSISFFLAMFGLPVAIIAAALWLAGRGRGAVR